MKASGYVSAPGGGGGGGSVLVVAYVATDGETVGVASVDEQLKILSPMSVWSMVSVNEGFVLPKIPVCYVLIGILMFLMAQNSPISHFTISNK